MEMEHKADTLLRQFPRHFPPLVDRFSGYRRYRKVYLRNRPISDFMAA